MEIIEAQFSLKPNSDQQAHNNANGKTKYIQESIHLVFYEIAISNEKEVFDHTVNF
jgi:hypothetical protein